MKAFWRARACLWRGKLGMYVIDDASTIFVYSGIIESKNVIKLHHRPQARALLYLVFFFVEVVLFSHVV